MTVTIYRTKNQRGFVSYGLNYTLDGRASSRASPTSTRLTARRRASQRGLHRVPQKTVAEAITEMLASKKAAVASVAYLKVLKFYLGRLAEAFHGSLKAVTIGDLSSFLRGLDVSPRSRNNARQTIGEDECVAWDAAATKVFPEGTGTGTLTRRAVYGCETFPITGYATRNPSHRFRWMVWIGCSSSRFCWMPLIFCGSKKFTPA